MKTSEYQYLLDTEQLNWLVKQTNRHKGQTQLLFNLCDGDFEKLKRLEEQLHNTFFHACPGDKATVEMVLAMQPQSNYFKLK